MTTYEVRFALETGYTLNVLVTAGSREDAQRDAGRILHGIGVKSGREYLPRDTEVRAVLVSEVESA